MKHRTVVEELIPVNTLILSDIHLGSEVSRADKALEILQSHLFKRLILLGDIFDDLNFKRLKKGHWNFLSYVRKLSNPKRNTEVIWVEGNHDEGLSDIMALMIGIDILKEYIWEVNNIKILAIHGHQFDRFLNENVIISNIASFIYDRLQRLGSENQTIARYIKKKSKGWLRLAGKMAHGAIDYAKNKNVNAVICGHTHIPTDEPIEGKSIKYYNTGCFTDVPSSYIVITEEGEIITKYI